MEAKKQKVLVIGDSLLKYLPEVENKLWLSYRGLTLERLQEKIISGHFDKQIESHSTIIVIVGTNNLKKQEPSKVVHKLIHIQAILKAKKRDLSIVLSGLVPRKDKWQNRQKETNKLLKVICKKEKIPFFETQKTFLHKNQIRQGVIAGDKLHLTKLGQTLLRQAILNYIDREIK